MDINRYTRSICLECGAYLDVITDVHANKHGFETAEDFINARKVRVINASTNARIETCFEFSG